MPSKLEFTSEESGQTYVWDKDTPPTDRDMAILVAADKAYLAQQAKTKEEVLGKAALVGGGGSMPASGMIPMGVSQATQAAEAAAESAKPAAVEAGMATTGQIMGSLAGPLGAAAGGFLGGAGGNIAAQTMRGQEVSLPEAVGAGVSAMIPGRSLAKGGLKALAVEAGKQAGSNVAGLGLQRLMEGQALDPVEAAAYAGMSGLSTYLGKVVDPGAIANRETRRQILQYEADKIGRAHV